MPTIRTTDSIAAGTQLPNVIAGNQFEFLAAPSRVQVFAKQDSTSTGTGEAEVFFSGEVQMPQAPVNVGDPGINTQQDLLVDSFGDRGDRILVRLIETGGANAAVITTMVVITPL